MAAALLAIVRIRSGAPTARVVGDSRSVTRPEVSTWFLRSFLPDDFHELMIMSGNLFIKWERWQSILDKHTAPDYNVGTERKMSNNRRLGKGSGECLINRTGNLRNFWHGKRR